MAEQDNTARQAVVNKLFGSVFGNVEQRIEMAPETPSQPARGEETEDAPGEYGFFSCPPQHGPWH